MAVLGGGNTNRVQTDNKIAIEDGTYEATIVDEWVHYVTKTVDGEWPDGRPKITTKYSKTPTDDREIKISVTLDDFPEIALEKRVAAYVSEKSWLGKMIASLTGMTAGSPEMRAWDTKGLRGMKCLVTTKFNGKEEAPYTRITEIRARPKKITRPAAAVAQPAAVQPAAAVSAAAASASGAVAPATLARIRTLAAARGIALDSEQMRSLVHIATRGAATEIGPALAAADAEFLVLSLERIPLPAPEETKPVETPPASEEPPGPTQAELEAAMALKETWKEIYALLDVDKTSRDVSVHARVRSVIAANLGVATPARPSGFTIEQLKKFVADHRGGGGISGDIRAFLDLHNVADNDDELQETCGRITADSEKGVRYDWTRLDASEMATLFAELKTWNFTGADDEMALL